jgi:4-amino-4-deoxy-L-arabinose transferase-like glycosyltransferase
MGGASSELIAYLKKHQDGAEWLLAVSSSQGAAQLILSSGEPVISMWGWSGSDRAMTLARLKELVENGELHYIQLGGDGGAPARADSSVGEGGGSSVSSEVTAWVRKHGTAVKGSDYGGSTNSDTGSGSGSSAQSSQSAVYRLDPSDVS